MDRLSVLVLTGLFPSNVDPSYAPFNRLQFAALCAIADVEVMGVVPWRFGKYYASGSSKDVVSRETIDELPVTHPRFPSIPGIPSLNAAFLATSLIPEILLRLRKKHYDVILAAYAYPDGCAGVLLSRLVRVPVVVKCHGSDLNRVPRHRAARFQIQHLLRRAGGVVTVSEKLRLRALELGVPASKLHVVYNGIDHERFRIVDREAARRRLRLPLDREIVLYVGHLADHKGTRDLLFASEFLIAMRPKAMVVFVGDGPLQREVQGAAEHGKGARGHLLSIGRVSHEEIPAWMAASDLVCLPSWDEGLPNVVREAHVSGRPVVATHVGGVPEAVHRPELGRLVPPHEPEILARAIADQLGDERNAAPERIRELAAVPTWQESAAKLHDVLCGVVRRS